MAAIATNGTQSHIFFLIYSLSQLRVIWFPDKTALWAFFRVILQNLMFADILTYPVERGNEILLIFPGSQNNSPQEAHPCPQVAGLNKRKTPL
jgi:hypothetical protein